MHLRGESYCPTTKSTEYKNGRRCDVRFLSKSGMDISEWEFAAYPKHPKVIGDRCRSARINQTILNKLLGFKLSDEEVDKINVPYVQIAGTNGEIMVEDLVESFYVVFPVCRFEIPTKVQEIEKLKDSIKAFKYCLVIQIFLLL